MQKYDYIVYIGRFQPFHDGHYNVLLQAFESAKKVIIVIGSANTPRTPKNPWTAEERMEMIRDTIINNMDVNALDNIIFLPVEDRLYKEAKWIEDIQSGVDQLTKGRGSIALIGHEKDNSSYYLKNNFPFWDFVETGPYIKERFDNGQVVSATKIRELIFENHYGYAASNLPEAVCNYMEYWFGHNDEVLNNLRMEYEEGSKEEQIYINLPYGMNFVTADSVVIQSGHVLLVQRDEFPGKGLWAIPGVHVDQNETVEDAAIRALVEETHLKVPTKVLKGSLKEVKIFDNPNRSLRGRLHRKNARTLTIAHHFQLDSSQPLPKNVRGGKGIRKAWWFSFAEVRKMRDQLFEDHADILDYFIG